jgi:hypothetical protein
LSFALERIGPLAAIITIVFYLLVLYLFVLPNTPGNQFASIYSESLIKTSCQHLLLLVGFDTLIYRKYYYTPPILVGHQYQHSLGRLLAYMGPTYAYAAGQPCRRLILVATLASVPMASLLVPILSPTTKVPMVTAGTAHAKGNGGCDAGRRPSTP